MKGVAGPPCRVLRDLRIHNRISGRKDVLPAAVLLQFEGNFMVVCHDHRHAEVFRGLQSLCRGNSIVTGHDRVDAVLSGLPDKALIDTVSVPHPLGKLCIRLYTEAPQRIPEDERGTDPVHVIIPDDPDPLSLPALFCQNIDSFFCIRQQRRIMKIFQRPPEELFCGFFPDHIPVPDQARKYGRDPAGLCYFVKIRPLGGYDPLLFLQDSLHH